eukprot:15481598-Alexandrium_andersonii.AAC.1
MVFHSCSRPRMCGTPRVSTSLHRGAAVRGASHGQALATCSARLCQAASAKGAGTPRAARSRR